jgi:hypothetical protein
MKAYLTKIRKNVAEDIDIKADIASCNFYHNQKFIVREILMVIIKVRFWRLSVRGRETGYFL